MKLARMLAVGPRRFSEVLRDFVRELLRDVLAGRVPMRGLRALALTAASASAMRLLYTALAWHKWRAEASCLTLTSNLNGAAVKLARPYVPKGQKWVQKWWPFQKIADRWSGYCPCCKRPIEMYRSKPWTARPPLEDAKGKFAFVINLWGASAEYVLGALVLGYSIKQTGSKHSRVCLHTGDVPAPFLALLSTMWELRLIEHIETANNLSVEDQCERFEKVFTKLRGMALTDFEKILVMDIDLLVRSNIDELFEVKAPAAMKRGMNDSWYAQKHGQEIDCSCFFLGKTDDRWSWGVGTGINAGTMLWQPDKRVLDEMLAELTEHNHPEHVRGNGPEQDYLSRFWADSPWTHIGVEYNFQLHQMFFGIHPDRVRRTERAKLLQNPERIKIVHYSGVSAAKPWHRILDEKWTEYWPDRTRDAEYAEKYAEEFQGHWLWVKRHRESFEAANRNPTAWDIKGMFVAEDGYIYRRPWNDPNAEPEWVEVPESASKGATNFLHSVLREWFDRLQELEQELGMDVRAALRDAAAAARESQAAADSGTGGTQGEAQAQAQAASSPVSPSSVLPSRGSWAPDAVPRFFSWDRPVGGWWTERATPGKTTATCGTLANRTFVSFIENGEEVYEKSEQGLAGVFVKVAGAPGHRHFSVPAPGEGEEDQDKLEEKLDEALDTIAFFVQGVPAGSTVLLAIVGVPAAALTAVLEALAPLGVPQAPPPATAKALAAAGTKAARTQGYTTSNFCTHASADVAYATVPNAAA